MVYFVFKGRLAVCHIIQGHFQQVPIDFGSQFQNCKRFLEYFGFCLLNTVYTKKQHQKNFHFYKQCMFYLGMSHFCIKCQYCFLAQIFLYTLKKNLSKKYVRFWKWNLNVHPKFVFKKIKFKFLHYMQHDFISQRLGLSKDHVQKFCY